MRGQIIEMPKRAVDLGDLMVRDGIFKRGPFVAKDGVIWCIRCGTQDPPVIEGNPQRCGVCESR